MIKIHALGAAREAIVVADLLLRGFEVYTAVAGNSSFDLGACKETFLLRVEVKGENKAPRTSPVCFTARSQKVDCHKFDILAIVEGQNVRYLRSLLHNFNAASKELVGEEVVDPNTRKDYIARRDAMQKILSIQ
jgi:hypothetical protein